MLKSEYTTYLLLPCLTGCVSKSNAQLPTSDEELLVVTGDITVNMEVVSPLSKSVPLSEESPKNYRDIETRITVTGSNGYRSNPDKAIGEGKYQISTGELQNGISYGVEIEYNGEIYIPSPSEPMKAPEIDSVSWIQPVKEQPLTTQVSTHGDPGKTRCYMWSYKEDWEARANYMMICYFDPETNRIYEDSNCSTFYYWKKELPRNILISSIQSPRGNRIMNNKLLEALARGDRFTVLYSVLVQQRALSEVGCEYYLDVQQQNEDTGGIFIPQPPEVQGNLNCTTQPERRATSYVRVYRNIVEERIYTRFSDIERSPRYTNCEKLTDDGLNEVGHNTYLTRYLASYCPVGVGTHTDNWTLQRYTKCGYSGGNKNKSPFWPNDHQ